MKIAFIGGGNMGEAILSAILDKGLSTPQAIFVSDIDDTRCQNLKRKYSVAVMKSNRLATEKAEVVILAVKPQNLGGVMTELNGWLEPGQLVLSIIAGATINTLCLGLNHQSIVRVMPNTPAQIGEGMSIWTATAEVNEPRREWARSILTAMGKEIYVNNEDYIDKATAISGSGPAYFFLFFESLVDAAVHIGLPSDMAKQLVIQTMMGSGYFIQRSGKEPSELRRMVTSLGGTTAEALGVLEGGGFF